MCGIFCYLSKTCTTISASSLSDVFVALHHRGPDYFSQWNENPASDCGDDSLYFCLCSSVLHMRGTELVEQPAQDCEGNLLAWNGEIFQLATTGTDSTVWDFEECDTSIMLKILQKCNGSELDIYSAIELVQGPFAFIYFHRRTNSLYFSRDYLGRRSLVWQTGKDGSLLLGSLVPFPDRSNSGNCGEVSPNGLYKLTRQGQQFCLKFFPWNRWIEFSQKSSTPDDFEIPGYAVQLSTFFTSNTQITSNRKCPMLWRSYVIHSDRFIFFESCLQNPEVAEMVERFHHCLLQSVKVRIRNAVLFCRNCARPCNHCNFAILFSGGIDSMIVAYYAHKFVPPDQPIDLLNVTFSSDSNCEQTEAPDRQTGKQGFFTLCNACPGRLWNFVQIDIFKTEVDNIRSSHLWKLVLPQQSVLDCSLGTALWFAARGQGKILTDQSEYASPARVLFSGLGADELLGGYSRHRMCFEKSGQDWARLDQELQEDIRRIGGRNCGRDDRVISDHGREVRYPFLDENVVKLLTGLPAYWKCDLLLPCGVGDKLLLRLLAYNLGLKDVSVLKKRALQFGSKIAKIDGSKSGVEKSIFLT